MGLDIIYLGKVKEPGELLGLGSELFEEYTFAVSEEFKERCHSFPLTNGMGKVYLTAESIHDSFRAGSYSGYNQFRDILCKAVHGISADDFWSSGRYWGSEAFGALIDFSDCEGTICYSVAAELYGDFKEYKNIFKKYVKANCGNEDSVYYIDKYNEWMGALKIASDKGLVIFC
jgi:hypothetical protein